MTHAYAYRTSTAADMMQGQPAGYGRLFLAGLNNSIFCLGRFGSVSRRRPPLFAALITAPRSSLDDHTLFE